MFGSWEAGLGSTVFFVSEARGGGYEGEGKTVIKSHRKGLSL